MRCPTLALASALALVAFADARAQYYYYGLEPIPYPWRRLVPPEAPHYHSSTYYEGVLRGHGVWISAYGDYLVDESHAAYMWEHVYALRRENELRRTELAIARKQRLQEYRDWVRIQREAQREYAREVLEWRYFENARSYELDEFQFDLVTGQINWPVLVAGPRYAVYRQRIERLIGLVVRYDMAGDRAYRDKLAKACAEFRDCLRRDAAADHPDIRLEYLAMQRFLLGLKYSPYLMLEPADERLAGRETRARLVADANLAPAANEF